MQNEYDVLRVGGVLPSDWQVDIGVEGGRMELLDNAGLTFILNLPNMTASERKALDGDIQVGCWVNQGGLPLIIWIIHFPGGGTFEGTFNSWPVNSDFLRDWIGTGANALLLCAHDQAVIKSVRYVGLDSQIINEFHNGIALQAAMEYSSKEFYLAYERIIARYTSDQLLKQCNYVQTFKREESK